MKGLQLVTARRSLLGLQVGLAVEILCLHVRPALFVGGLQDDHVARYLLVFADSDDVSDSQLIHCRDLEASLFQQNCRTIILFLVFEVAIELLIGVLHEDCEGDKDEGNQHKWLSASVGYGRDGLQHGNNNEVD